MQRRRFRYTAVVTELIFFAAPTCQVYDLRIKIILDADSTLQPGDAVTLAANAIYGQLDTAGSTPMTSDTGVSIGTVMCPQ